MQFNSLLLLALLSLGCSLTPVSVDDSGGPECRPTGRASIDTGVWLGDGGCTSIELILSETGEFGSLNVGYNDYQSAMPLTFWNRTTDDHEREALFSGYPEFRLFIGDYPLSGLEMAEGPNEIAVYEWPCVSLRCVDDVPFQEFVVTASCRGSDGAARPCP